MDRRLQAAAGPSSRLESVAHQLIQQCGERHMRMGAAHGATEALRSLNLEGLAGRPIEEIFLGLADYVKGAMAAPLSRSPDTRTYSLPSALMVHDLPSPAMMRWARANSRRSIASIWSVLHLPCRAATIDTVGSGSRPESWSAATFWWARISSFGETVVGRAAGCSRHAPRHRRNLPAQDRVPDRRARPSRRCARSSRRHPRGHRLRCHCSRQEVRQLQHHPARGAWHNPRLDRAHRQTRLQAYPRHRIIPFVHLGQNRGEFEGAGPCPAPSWGEFERGGLPPFHTGSIGPKSGSRFWE